MDALKGKRKALYSLEFFSIKKKLLNTSLHGNRPLSIRHSIYLLNAKFVSGSLLDLYIPMSDGDRMF